MPAALSVAAEAAAELADEAAERTGDVADEDEESVSVASASVAVADELPLVCEEPDEVEELARDEADDELEP